MIFPHWLFFKTRTLNYIWANQLSKGSIQKNVYTGNAMMIAVESGPSRAGEWVTEQRNLLDDYRQAFGEDAPGGRCDRHYDRYRQYRGNGRCLVW